MNDTTPGTEPRITRVRHEIKRRKLTVREVLKLPPGMIRVVLVGDDLPGFTSLGFDDHIKVIVPLESGETVMRDFTPRHYDPGQNELWVDFFIHDAGPATAWASKAAVGDTLEIGGPRGSSVIEIADIKLHVLMGDETAIPAIQRRLGELPPNTRALTLIETAAGATRPALSTRAELEVAWVPRDPASKTPGAELITALKQLQFPTDRCFAWIGHETQTARAIRNYLRTERGMDKSWIKAAGYWQRGATGAHQTITED